jgi:hypothetical protein
MNPQPLCQTAGCVKGDVHVKGQLFAIEEISGFHGQCPTEEDRRFIVLLDMRKVWSSLFIVQLTQFCAALDR